MPQLREKRNYQRSKRYGVRENPKMRWAGKDGEIWPELQSRSLQGSKSGSGGRREYCMVRDLCQLQSGRRQTAWLTHPGPAITRTPSLLPMPRGTRTACSWWELLPWSSQAASPRTPQALYIRASHCWSTGG